MNEIDPNKYAWLINRNNKSKKESKKYFKKLAIRIFIVMIVFLLSAIGCNYSSSFKASINKYVFTDNISFIKIKRMYNKYLGGILPLKKDVDTEKVFNEKLSYSDVSIYYDGIKLSVSDGYLVPSIKEGMVVFIGDKDNYGTTIIIEDLDGTYIWYGNIISTSLKLYDYIEKGSYIGEVNKELYMVFSRNNEYLNYEEYIG